MSTHTPSSLSSSSRDPSTSGQHDTSLFDNEPITTTPASSKAHDSPSSHASTRRSGRHGGFLLDSLSRPSRSSMNSKSSASGKGKEPEYGTEQERVIASPHRRSLSGYDRSVRSSPLASHVASVNGDGGDGDIGESRHSAEAAVAPASRHLRPHVQLTSRETRQTDPTTLMNLALQLSQSRGRVASARFNPHLAGAGSSGRVVSVGSPKLPLNASQNRRASATQQGAAAAQSQIAAVAPENTEINPGIPVVNGIGTQYIDSFGPGIATSLDMPSTIPFLPSPQTMIRAERARIALELRYHYRRLLRHVPRYPDQLEGRPRAGTIKSESGKNAAKPPTLEDPSMSLGIQYNPLQYARNRKTRYREQCTLDAESRGWKDLDRVKAWIDKVAAADHGKTPVAALRRFSLPDFDPQDDTSALDHIGNALDVEAITRPRPKVTLPRNDWTNNPWDLLADMHWVYQGGNRTLIEDHNGDKVFPLPDSATHHSKPNGKIKRPGVNADKLNSASAAPIHANHNNAPPAVSPDNTSSDEAEDLGPNHSHGPDPAREHATQTKQSKVKRFSKRFSRARAHSSSDDASDDDAQQPRTRPWSGTFAKKWHGTHMPEKKPPTRVDAAQTRASVVRSSFELPYPRQGSGEGKRPFSLGSDSQREISDGSVTRPQFAVAHPFSEIDSTAPSSPAYSTGFPRLHTDSDERVSSAPRPAGDAPATGAGSRYNEIERKDFADDPFDDNKPGQRRRGMRRHRTATLSSPSETSFSAGSDDRGFPVFQGKDQERYVPYPDRDLGFHPLKPWKAGTFVGRARDLLRRRDFGSDTSDSDTDSRRKTTRSPLSRATTSSSFHDTLSAPALETVGESPQYQGPELPTFRSTRPTGSPSSRDRKRPSQTSWQRPSVYGQDDVDTPSSQKDAAFPAIKVSSATEEEASSRAATDDQGKTGSSAPHSRGVSQRRGTNERRGATVTDDSGFQWPVKQRTDAPPWPGQDRHGQLPNGVVWTGPELRPVKDGIVEPWDLHRVEMLLLSTILKVNRTSAHYESIPSEPTKRLAEIRQFRARQAPVARVEEAWVLAQCLGGCIDKRSAALDEALRRFSTDTQAALAARYADAKDRVQDTLMEKALVAGDRADALGAEMAGKCTLDVKELNDRIDLLWRRRRRRSRWLRRILFTSLEWTVLAIMWGLWFLVISFKVAKASLRGAFGVFRWLLWLD